MTRGRRATRAVAPAAAVLLLCSVLAGCAGIVVRAPRCDATERVALVAQSVPTSSYLPCIRDLPAGWDSSGFTARDGATRFDLRSDRASHPVTITFGASCRLPSAATPIEPRTPGGRTYLAVNSIDPDYSATMYDVFPGGCVQYRFRFARGAHIALIAQLQQAVGFISRPDLERAVRSRLGVELPP